MESSLQRVLNSLQNGWTTRILTHITQAIPFPGVPAIGSVLADVRSSAFLAVLEKQISQLQHATKSDDELEDLFLRAMAGARRAASEAKAESLACTFVTVSVAKNVTYADAVQILDDLDALSDFEPAGWQVQASASGRLRTGETLS